MPVVREARLLADPVEEIRLKGLHPARGFNFWSRRPVIRMDLAVGAFDQISSADAPGVLEALLAALPGLVEHECSIGARGGFVERLRQGTFAPHIIEHVALELQQMIGHDVSYGQTRGGDEPGEYTLVFEHRHEQVGLRAAATALEVVQRAFAGTLASVEPALEELRLLDTTDDASRQTLDTDVLCGITGGALRHETQHAIDACLDTREVIVDVAPSYLLRAGLPYSRSEMAVLLDTELTDVSERYRTAANARKLVGTLVDGTRRHGLVICPAREWELQDYARDQGCRVAIFAPDDDVTRRDRRVAMAVGLVTDGHVVIEHEGTEREVCAVSAGVPVAPQVVAALVQELVDRQKR